MALKLWQSPTSTVVVRPYSGALPNQVVNIDGTTIAEAPTIAWADLGLVKHMSAANELSAYTRPQTGPCLLRGVVVSVALLENVLTYFTYFQVRNPEDHLHNKFEAHMPAFPYLDLVLLVLAICNTVYLLMCWAALSLVGMDIYISRSLAIGRVLFSIPVGCVCMMLTVFAERIEMFPFFCTISVMLYVGVLVLGEVLLRKVLSDS